MRSCDGPTVGEALREYWVENGLDSTPTSSSTWTCRMGPVTIRLPNYDWRRRAILTHDLHHILTGYPCTMRGEFQLATWEFAAGRFPHPAATLICLPLVIAGILWSPRAIFSAFLFGRRCHSLYGTDIANEEFLNTPISTLTMHSQQLDG